MKENNIHKMIRRNVDRQLVREFLLKETERAGFGGLTFNRTPEGTKVTLRAEQVGRVIGRRGKVIHDLQRRLQEDFDLDNPQLEVEEIEESRTNAQVMARHIKYCGETALQLMEVGFSTAVKKLGTIGCTVRIMRPGAKLPHEITIQERSESGLPDLVEASGFVPLELEEALERAAREEE